MAILRSRALRLSALLLLCLLVFCGWWIQSGSARAVVLARLRDGLRQQNILLEGGRLEYDIFGLTATLHEVTLRSSQTPDLPPVATIQRAQVSFNWRTFSTLTLDLDSALLTGVSLHVVVDQSGRHNLPQLPRRQGPPVAWLIRQLTAPGASLFVEDRRHGVSATLNPFTVNLKGAAGQHVLSLSAATPAELLYQGRRLLWDISLDALIDKNAITLRQALLTNATSRVSLQGGLENWQALATLDVASLARFLGRPEPLTGQLLLDANAQGVKVRGSVSDVQLEAYAQYDASQQRVRISDATVDAAYGAARLSAEIALEKGESRLTADLERINLEKLAALVTSDIVPASVAAASVTARWPALDFARASANGSLRLRPSVPDASQNRLPIAADVTFSGQLDQVSAQVRSLSVAGAEASGTLYLDGRQNLRGELKAGADSVAAVVRQANLLLGKSVSLNGFDGRVALTGTLGGTLTAPTLDAAIGAEEDQHGIQLSSGLTYQGQLVTASGVAVRWKGQTLSGEGTLNLADQTLDWAAHAGDLKVNQILDGPYTGNLQAEIRGGGTLAEPTASLALAGSGLSAYGETLGTLEAQANFSGGVFRVSQLLLPLQKLQATGSYRLDDRTYSVDASSPALSMTYGTFALTAKGSGTLENPQLIATASNDEFEARAVVQDRAAMVRASAPKYQATAQGRVGIDAPYPASFSLEANAIPLARFTPLTGVLRGTAQGAGALEQWRQATASFRVEPIGVQWQGEAITSDGPILGEVADGVLNLKQARLLAAGSSLSIEGRLPLPSNQPPSAQPGVLRLNGSLDLAILGGTGKAAVDGEVRGNLQRIDPTATISLRDGTFGSASALQFDARLQDGKFSIERATGTWAKAKLSASGEFPLGLLPRNLPIEFPRASGLARLTADAVGVDLAAIPGAPAHTSGTVTVHLEAESAKAELSAIQGRATVEELRVRLGEIALEQSGKSAIEIADGLARIESLALRGPGTELALRGRASLLGDYPLGLRLAGQIETAVLSTLTAPARMRGPARIQLSVYGPARAPLAAGFVELTDAQLLVSQPRIAADKVNARLNLTGDRLTIGRFDGTLNGGTVSAQGSLRFAGGEAREVDLSLNGENVYLDYPFGLRTLSNAALTLKQNGERFVLGGAVDIVEGSFRELVTIEGNLLSMLNSPAVPLEEEPNPYLNRTQFNVNIATDSPLLVRNNLAKAGMNLNLRLAGSYYRPALLGRITLEEGGELYFSERSYSVDRGVVTFTNDQKIEPTIDVLAKTRVASHDVSLQIAGGGAQKISTTLSSDPAVPEQDILAMLITGKSPDEYKKADTGALAGRQALSYFAGSFGSQFTRQLERATGLSTVRVEPDLIANESNPTARLTVGQDLSRAARLIYSMNLANGGDQIYVAEYDVTKRFTTRGVKQIDNTYRFEFRHDLRFGGEKPATKSKDLERRVIGQVQIPAGGAIPEQKLRAKFKNKPGQRYDFFNVRKGLDRVEKLHRDEDLLEAHVRLGRDVKPGTVDLTLEVEPGSKLVFAYEGWEPGRRLRNQIREIWWDGVFDAQRLDDATRAIRLELIEGGFLEAKVEPKVTVLERKLVTFDVRPGPRYGAARVEFPGAASLPAGELNQLLKRRDLRNAVYTDPPKIRDFLQSYYRERGYLDAIVKTPQVEYGVGAATVTIPLAEGPRYRVASVKFEGNTAMKPEELLAKSELKADEPYELPLRKVSLEQLRELYYAAGFREAQVEAGIARQDGKVEVTYRINQGPQEVVEKIEISGNDATSERLVRSQLALKAGDILEPEKVTGSRRNLYSTGAYSLVDLERVPLGDVTAAGVKPMLLRAKVREVQPFDLRYGAYFDTDRGPGAVVDFTNRNSLGSARAIGARLRYDSDFREGRVFFSQPLLRRFPVQSIASGFVNRSLLPTFITDRVGVSAQQEVRFRTRYLLNYGYRLERVHTYEKTPDPFLPFDVSLRVAPLTFTMNRESRDDLLDSTRGSFLSHAFEWAPEALGSDVRFIRYYAQYFKYFALGKATEIPLSGGLKKPRLVYAAAGRMGLARGLGGQDLVVSERFFGGGGTTLRGFAQNSLGPQDFLSEPSGGNAIVLINNELRFPIASIFDGVGFVDVGNVYRRVGDISAGDLRKAAGAGLRIRTPYFLLRLDYGFKLDRRPGESRGGFFFSIGQAF